MAEDAASLDAPPLHKPSSDVDDETRALVVPEAADLPASPPSAVEANFIVCGWLAPTHVVLKEEGAITVVVFNVGKSDRSEMKVTGKRKRNAQHLQENSVLCEVCLNDKSFIVSVAYAKVLQMLRERFPVGDQ